MIDRYEEASVNVVDMTSCYVADATKYECTTVQKVAMEDPLNLIPFVDSSAAVCVALAAYVLLVILATAWLSKDER